MAIPLSPLLIRISSSKNVVSRLPFAESGAVTGIKPKILNFLNWTLTSLAEAGVSSASTCKNFPSLMICQTCMQSPEHIFL